MRCIPIGMWSGLQSICRCRALAALLVLLVSPAAEVPAQPAQPAERAVPRTIVVLYDGSVDREWRDTLLHQMAEMPLNHLGLVVEPHDVNKPLPEIAGRPDARRMLTWWRDEGLPDPGAFLAWAGRAVDAGKRVAVLGSFGFLRDRGGATTPLPAIEGFLGRLGLRFHNRSYVRLWPFMRRSRAHGRCRRGVWAGVLSACMCAGT